MGWSEDDKELLLKDVGEQHGDLQRRNPLGRNSSVLEDQKGAGVAGAPEQRRDLCALNKERRTGPFWDRRKEVSGGL